MIRRMFIIGFGAIVIAMPILFNQNLSGFKGTDDQAKNKISQINSDYKPWFNLTNNPFFKFNESTMFSLQAALGVGFVVYYIGKKKDV